MTTIVIDFETFYGTKYSLTSLSYEEYIFSPKFKIHCCGFKVDNEDSYVVWGHHNVINEVQNLLPPDNEVAVVLHNALFDGPIISWVCNAYPALWIDTKAICKLLYPSESSSLDNMAALILNKAKGKALQHFKDVEEIPEQDRFAMKRYCQVDIELTYELYKALSVFVPQEQMELMHITTEMYVSRPFRVDKALLLELIDEEEAETARIVKESGLSKTVLGSTKQFAEWILEQGMEFKQISAPTINNPDNKKWPLGKDSEEFVDLQHRYPEHEKVWKARVRVASNITVTRAKRFLAHSAYHPLYNPYEALGAPLVSYGAHTHRWSGTNRINLQNLGRGSALRTALLAEEGKVLVVHDQKQIEARVLAWLARCDTLNRAYANGEDVYSQFAEIVYERPINADDDKLERFVGKVCILGLGYQMGARRLYATLKMGVMGPPVLLPMEQCEKLVQAFRATYWEIPQLWSTAQHMIDFMCKADAEQHHAVTFCGSVLTVYKNAIGLPDGTFMQYPKLHYHYANQDDNDEGYRYWNGKYMAKIYGGKLVENLVQALAKIIVAGNALDAYRFPTSQLALLVHDEIVASVPESDAQLYFDHMTYVMRQPPAWADSSLALDVEGGYAREYSK